MKSLRFEQLWLLSERQRKARKIPLQPGANALVGKNHTGKSTVLRCLFSVLGCQPRSLGGDWDKGTILALDMRIETRSYTIMRGWGAYTLFDEDKLVLWSTTDAGILRDKLSELFGFVLTLTPSGANSTGGVVEGRHARPAFYFIPFYVDQDGSWDSSWRTFQGLGEFSQWERATLDLALGIRTASYWSTMSQLLAKKSELDEAKRERKVLHAARARLVERFPRNPWFRDAMQFRRELKELEQKAGKLTVDQDALRSRATETAASRDSIHAQLQLLDSALGEHSADMQYLDNFEIGKGIGCPTCGTLHDHSFHERLNLEAEADELRQLRLTLNVRLTATEADYESISQRLLELDNQARKIEELLNVERGKLKLREVVDRAGIDRAHSAFDEQTQQIEKRLGEIAGAIDDLSGKLEALDNKTMAKEIRAYFNVLYADFARQLDVPASLRERKGEIKTKPQQGGSGGPRAVLAYYFAMAHTAARYSPALMPPLVIDSPHQKAQDEINRPIVTEFIFRNQVKGQQLIVGLEEDLPENVQLSVDSSLIKLDQKYGLLRDDQYLEGVEFIGHLLALTKAYRLSTPQQ